MGQVFLVPEMSKQMSTNKACGHATKAKDLPGCQSDSFIAEAVAAWVVVGPLVGATFVEFPAFDWEMAEGCDKP